MRVYAAGDPEPLASGQLDFVDSSVDTATGTIMAKATFANQDFSLWPGQYVDVEIDLDTRPDTISIPTVALQTSQKGPFVFVVKPDGIAELRHGGDRRHRRGSHRDPVRAASRVNAWWSKASSGSPMAHACATSGSRPGALPAAPAAPKAATPPAPQTDAAR